MRYNVSAALRGRVGTPVPIKPTNVQRRGRVGTLNRIPPPNSIAEESAWKLVSHILIRGPH
eukprot:3838413-Amphidinium_carterae.1